MKEQVLKMTIFVINFQFHQKIERNQTDSSLDQEKALPER